MNLFKKDLLASILGFHLSIYVLIIVLSIFSLLTPFWVSFIGSLIILFWLRLVLRDHNPKSLIQTVYKEKRWWPLIILALLLFTQGLLSAPNTTDSMTYHLPRVIHWLGNKTVFQKSSYTIMDFVSPYGDYLLLLLYTIGFGDRWLFIAQFSGYLTSLFATYQISQLLFAKDNQIAYISTMLAATIPNAVLQANSTQIELTTTSFILLSFYFLIQYRKHLTSNSIIQLYIAVTMGFLTKVTILFFFPLLLLFSFNKQVFVSSRKRLRTITIGFASCILLLFPFFLNNIHMFGQPLGELRILGEKYSMTNEVFTVSSFISNIVRNFFLHIPAFFFQPQLQSVVINLHNLITFPLNEPRTTWLGTTFLVQSYPIPQEDIAGNPLHFLLFVLISFGFLCKKAWRTNFRLLLLFGIWSFWIFFAIVLKWQPWHTRLHLPAFFVISILTSSILVSYSRLTKLLLTISFIISICLIFFNLSRPLFHYPLINTYITSFFPENIQPPSSILLSKRSSQYFYIKQQWEAPYVNLANDINLSAFPSVCLKLIDGFEYPLWALSEKHITYSPSTLSDCNAEYDSLKITSADQLNEIEMNNGKCFFGSFSNVICIENYEE